jgi:hypothetical protein
MQPGIAPGNEAAVIPDKAVPVVEGDHGHGVFLALKLPVRMVRSLGINRQIVVEPYTGDNGPSISEVAR